MRIRGFVFAAALLTALDVQAQPLNIPKEWRGRSAVELLALPEVKQLPFVAQDQLLLAADPEYKKLARPAARELLLAQERQGAAFENRKPLSFFVWYQAAEGCDSFYQGGRQFFTVYYSPLVLTIALSEYENHTHAWVYATNATDSKIAGIDILVRNISLASTKPRVKLCEREDADKVARGFQKRARWRAALVGGLGGMATKSSTTTYSGDVNGSYSGSGGSGTFNGTVSGEAVTTQPDYEARRAAAERVTQIRREAALKANGLTQTALRDTTIRPGETIAGFVYFKREKQMETAVLRVVVGTVAFEFPVSWR